MGGEGGSGVVIFRLRRVRGFDSCLIQATMAAAGHPRRLRTQQAETDVKSKSTFTNSSHRDRGRRAKKGSNAQTYHLNACNSPSLPRHWAAALWFFIAAAIFLPFRLLCGSAMDERKPLPSGRAAAIEDQGTANNTKFPGRSPLLFPPLRSGCRGLLACQGAVCAATEKCPSSAFGVGRVDFLSEKRKDKVCDIHDSVAVFIMR